MIHDIRAAFSFLTIVPLGAADDERKPGWSFAWYPLVGAAIGALLASVAAYAPVGRDLNALLVLLVWVVISGGLHLDGFGDSCDGLMATRNPEERLAIMRDPRAGNWAVIGLVLLLLAKWLAIRELDAEWLLLPAALWTLGAGAGGISLPRRPGQPNWRAFPQGTWARAN